MSAVTGGNEETKVNNINSMKHWSEIKRYNEVQGNVVSEQLNISMLEIEKERKLLTFIYSEEWPDQTQTTKENVLRTTMRDEKLNHNV